MTKEKQIEGNEPVLQEITEDFGEGKFVSWKDGDEKIVVITQWGQYEKKTEDGLKLAFRASVINVDGREYKLGEKVIDTTSINFMKTIKQILFDAKSANEEYLRLRITRAGDKKDTKYVIRKLTLKPGKEEVETEEVAI